ncbi:hypothetical protein J7J58_07030 [candidate division WOR-3 bacterium]|nr:hypothetical protein [candidate division WOR-3 bacterium]
MKKVILFFVITFVSLTSINALPCDSIIPMNNREYTPKLINLINEAKDSINVLIFTARIYKKYSNSINDKIYDALLKAMDRGVKVTMILDVSSWNMSNTRKNIEFAKWIEEKSNNKINILYDPGMITSHNKIILIDNYISIVGSMNWSYYALELNREASVAVFSKSVYSDFERYFSEIRKRSLKEPELL